MLTITRWFVSGIMLFVVVGTALAQPATLGKIPVTTSSPEARDLYLHGRMLAESFKNAEARGLFEQAIAKDPNFALAYRDLAQSQPSLKEFRESMAKAVSLVDKVSNCEREWILADDAAGKLDLAKQREYLGKLIQDCGQDEHGHSALGIYYFGRQYFDSAAAELTKATDLAPSFLAAWNMLGYARRNLNDYDGAEKAFQKYIQISPGDANAYDSYAELLLKEGKYDDAIAQYRKAMSTDTTFVISLFNMAAPLVYLGRHDDARHELEILLRKAADDGQRQTAYFGIAASYVDQGKFDDAVTTLQKSAALMEKINDSAALMQNAATIGFLRLEQGQYDEALKQYEKSADIARKAALPPKIKTFAERNLFYAKARIAAIQGNTARATAYVDSFAVMAKASGTVDDLRAMHQLNGIVALDAKQYAKAVDELKQGPAQNGADMYRLALAYRALGDNQKATEQITNAAHNNNVLNLNDALVRQKAVQLVGEWAKK